LKITAKNIRLKNVRYRMEMMPIIDSIDVTVPFAELSDGVVDMGQGKITAKSLAIDSVKALYLTPSAEYLQTHPVAATPDTVVPTSDSQLWTINADRLHLTASQATYAMRGAEPLPGLDMNYLSVTDVEIAVDSFYNRGTSITVPIKRIKATERSGISLDANGTFAMDSTLMRADNFDIRTTFSSLKLNAAMGVGDLTTDPNLPMRLKANGMLALADIELAMPAMSPMLRDIPRNSDIILDADIAGTSGFLTVDNISAELPGFASVHAEGSVANPFDFNAMSGKIQLNGNFSNLNPIKPTLLEAKMAKEVKLPPMKLDGAVNYNPGKIDGNIALMAAGGKIAAKAMWQQKAEGYDINLNVNRFPVDAFMPSLGVGKVFARLEAKGTGLDPSNPRSHLTASIDIDSITYLGKRYSDITAQADLQNAHIVGSLVSNNPGAEVDIDFTADFLKQGYTWDIDGHVLDLDLQELNLSPTANGGSLTIKSTGYMSSDAKTINAKADIISFDWNLDGKRLYSPETSLNFNATDSFVTADFTSGDLSAKFASPNSLDSLLTRIDKTLAVVDSSIAKKNVNILALQKAMPGIDLQLASGPNNFIASYLASLGIQFNSAKANFRNDSLFSLSTDILGFSSGTTRLDTISFGAVQHGKFLPFKGAVNNRPGTFDNFAHVNISGFLADDKFGFMLNQKNIENEQGFVVGISATMQDSIVSVRFVPYAPTIGYKKWHFNKDNFLSYNFYTRHIDANLMASSDKSYIKIYTEHVDGNEDEQEDLFVKISDIHIQDWLSISPYSPPLKGDLGADMKIHWNDNQLTGNGVLSLNNLFYGKDKVGSFDIGVDVLAGANGVLNADASLLVDSIKVITAKGVLNDSTATNPFLLDFSMIHFPLHILNPFLPREYARLSGMLNGQMDITGSLVKPVFNGFIDFDSTAVNVGMLGTSFKFSEEKIPVDSSIVKFNNFSITAANKNPLSVNGTVDLTELSSAKINLDMLARNMQIVNSNRPKKADVYGKAFIDMDASVKGSMALLNVDAKLKVLPGTNVTYIMTNAQSAITSQTTGDMVKFVQFSDTTATMVADSLTESAMAINLEAELTISQGSTINVDLSTDGKNKVSLLSQGTLDFSMNPFNDGRLTGRLNINGGFVRYTPPMLSEKLFHFQEGSFVAFNGDMLNPILNIHAVDKLKANVTQQGQNSRIIDFNVSVAITNTLSNMNVAFDLSTNDDITVQNELASMSPDQRANQAMNMLLYNVYSGPGTKASTNLSGNPLYSFLESQINSWAANNIRGVDISFGIDQYDKTTDGVSQQTTSYSYRVSKTLFNDRFKIIVGGNYSTDANADENFSQNLINDIAFEYMLNRSGSMYVRLFRHTGYESILEGEVTQTGVGFVLRRKINSFADLFRWAGRLKNSITGKNDSKSAVSPSSNTTADETDSSK
ncbi:MAG: translocation/assembly module TamB, partial [Paramuribaculum sp.]|nr:translocation/assembly module TamB [Paramuribaculum sp.]